MNSQLRDWIAAKLIKGLNRYWAENFVHGNGLHNKPGFECLSELTTNLNNEERAAEWKQKSLPMTATLPDTWN